MIEKRSNATYRVRTYHQGRYVGSRTFRRKAEAQAWDRRQQESVASGTWVHPEDGAVTVAEWIEKWWRSRADGWKPSTGARYRSLLDLHVLPAWGRKPVNSVRHSDVAAWAGNLARDYSASTSRQALLLLRQPLDVAVLDGLLVRNPASGVKLPTARANDPQPLTHEELWRLAHALDGPHRVMVLVMGYGGLRWGEASALRVRDVSDQGRCLTVRQAVSEVSGHVVVGTPKNHAGRSVVLPSSVGEEVASLVKIRLRDSSHLLFSTSRGTHLRNGNWRTQVLNPALERADLPAITPHNLRDTSASLAIAAGASVVAVARMLGHESAATTLRHYASLFPGDLTAVAILTDEHARAAKIEYTK